LVIGPTNLAIQQIRLAVSRGAKRLEREPDHLPV